MGKVTVDTKYETGDVVTFTNSAKTKTYTGVIIGYRYDEEHRTIAYNIITKDTVDNEVTEPLHVAEDNIVSGIGSNYIDLVWEAIDKEAEKIEAEEEAIRLEAEENHTNE